MTHRTNISVASGLVFLLIALAGLLLLVPASSGQPSHAQCSANCKAAYGSCYKSTQDRNRCQAQQQRCLEGCIRSKR